MPRLRPAKKDELFDSEHDPLSGVTRVSSEEAEAVKEAAGTPVEPEPFQQEEPAPVAAEPAKDDAAEALKKQIEEIRRAEELRAAEYQREREAAQKAAAEQAERYGKSEQDRLEAEKGFLETGLTAAKALHEKAVSEYRQARNNGDIDAETEAMSQMTMAAGDIRNLERGLEEFKKERERQEQQAKTAAAQPQPQQSQPPPKPTMDQVTAGLPAAEAAWLRQHPDYIEDSNKYARLTHAAGLANTEGYRPGDPNFLPRIEAILEWMTNGGAVPAQPEPRRTPPVSAPVSREVPSASGSRSPGKITLTAEQREAAKLSGVTEAEYARQLMKYRQMVADGTYGDRK